jgi:SAM-dependent methyltransferase
MEKGRSCVEVMLAYQKFAYVYDELMQDMPYDRWVEFAEAAWERYGKPETVAELGCGTGSVTLPLAQAGYKLMGIDVSQDMLTVAQSKLEASAEGQHLLREGRVRWLCQDMREWDLPQPVDSVISFCDCINYVLEPEEIVEVFKRTYANLKEGGSFLFDVHHPDTLRRYYEEQPFVQDDPSVSYIWTCGFDKQRWEIKHHLSIFAMAGTEEANRGSRTGRGSTPWYERFEETHVQRAYDPDWMKVELRRAGFRDIQCFADFTWESADDEAERLFFVAIK